MEKKKFKQGEVKQHVAKVEAEQQAIYGQKRQVEEKLGQIEADKD